LCGCSPDADETVGRYAVDATGHKGTVLAVHRVHYVVEGTRRNLLAVSDVAVLVSLCRAVPTTVYSLPL
jgi:hypothetical protein